MTAKAVTVLVLANHSELALSLIESFNPSSGKASALTPINGFLGRYYNIDSGELELIAAPVSSDLPSIFDILAEGLAGCIVAVDCTDPASLPNLRKGLEFWELISDAPRLIATVNHDTSQALTPPQLREMLNLSDGVRPFQLPCGRLQPAIVELLKRILK